MAFLAELKEKVADKNVAIVMDNCTVHKTKQVKKKILIDYKWLPIFNVAYCPQYMPIEFFFSALKHKYKQLMLEDRVVKDDNENNQQTHFKILFHRATMSFEHFDFH